MTEADLIVRDLGNPTTRESGWWSAACKHCGRLLTKHDFTREECVAIALTSEHICKLPGQLGLL